MSNHIHYKGKLLGTIKLKDAKSGSLDFIAKDIVKMKELFGIGPEEEIQMESVGSMSYREFNERYLKKVERFYNSLENWAKDNFPQSMK